MEADPESVPLEKSFGSPTSIVFPSIATDVPNVLVFSVNSFIKLTDEDSARNEYVGIRSKTGVGSVTGSAVGMAVGSEFG